MLGRLRANRVVEARATRTAPLRELFVQAARDATRDRRRLGNAGDAWAQTCPPDLAGRTAIVGLLRGVLTVSVPDSPTRFELDRALRGGAEKALIGLCTAPVRKVRVVVTG